MLLVCMDAKRPRTIYVYMKSHYLSFNLFVRTSINYVVV